MSDRAQGLRLRSRLTSNDGGGGCSGTCFLFDFLHITPREDVRMTASTPRGIPTPRAILRPGFASDWVTAAVVAIADIDTDAATIVVEIASLEVAGTREDVGKIRCRGWSASRPDRSIERTSDDCRDQRDGRADQHGVWRQEIVNMLRVDSSCAVTAWAINTAVGI